MFYQLYTRKHWSIFHQIMLFLLGGSRKNRTCSHSDSIIHFSSFARHEKNLNLPAEQLSVFFTSPNAESLDEEDENQMKYQKRKKIWNKEIIFYQIKINQMNFHSMTANQRIYLKNWSDLFHFAPRPLWKIKSLKAII